MAEVILLDGKMMAYRAHYSHLGLRTKDREPTGLLHGFFFELLRINKRAPKAAMVVCWDGVGKTWRHLAYPPYKAQRKPNPQWKEMKAQTDVLLPILRKLGFHVAQIDGVEADDIIGILSHELESEIRIYSGDRDMYQLVCDRICVWPAHDKPVLKKKEVEQWLRAPIEALISIKAMMGDPADNLKGLKGVGPVSARKMWKNFPHMVAGKERKRLLKEADLLRIVQDVNSEVWTEEQKEWLTLLRNEVCKNPFRNQKLGMQQKDEFYKFLGHYELVEVFKKRHEILSLP